MPSDGGRPARAPLLPWSRWLALLLWPFPNLRTWVAFAVGVVTGELLVVFAVALGWVVIRL